ncbi:LysR family transcriptional regulator [soil metagenome]
MSWPCRKLCLVLSTERLRLLSAVARAGSFSGAAQAAYVSASAVSQQMAVLEREVGATLFERGPRGVRLTAIGEALAARAEGILSHLRDAQAEVQAMTGTEGGRVCVGSFPTATSAFAAGAVAAFRQRHPGVEVRFVDGEPAESITRLRARELDLAVVFDLDLWPAFLDYDGTLVAEETDVELVDFFDDPFFLLVPDDHRLAGAASVPLWELAGEPFIGSSHDCAPWGPDFALACRRAGFEPNFEARYSSVDFSALQAFVASGLGLTLLPRLAARAVRDGVVLLPLEGAPTRRVKLAVPAGSYRAPATTAMMQVLHEVVDPG